jgi:chromosome segregation ATPase
VADRVRMTVLQAAEALGVSDDTIRRGLEGKGPLADLLRDAGSKDNTGRWMIALTTEAIERNRSLGRRHRQHTPPEAPLAEAETASLRKLAEVLRTASGATTASQKEELERLAAAHSAEVGRLHEELERTRIRAAQAEAEREQARVQAAAAEGEVKALRERAEQAEAGREAAQAEAAAQRGRADLAIGEVDGLKLGLEHMQEVLTQARREADQTGVKAEQAARAAKDANERLARLHSRGVWARLRNRP